MIDYMIMEALAAKDAHEQNEARKKAEQDRKIEEFKNDRTLEERIASAA